MRYAAVVLATVLLGVGSALAAEPPQPKEVPLFNGKNLDGWVWRGKSPEAENPFYVKDGLLCCKGQPVGYLHTEKKYTDYIFKLEWRWPEGSKPGNNGILVRVLEGEHFYGNTWPKCIEIQLAHQHAGDILTIGDFPLQTGRNKGRFTPMMKKPNEKPQGQWNEYEVTMQGGRLKLVVNGELQNEGTKAGELPGTIGLQSEGAPIEFRRIRLVPLD
jgi:hypothetical protein